MADWIEALKPGDPVTVVQPRRPNQRFRGVVARKTKTMVVLESGRRFRIADGKTPGSDVWTAWPSIEPYDPTSIAADRLARQRQQAWKQLRNLTDNSPPPEHLTLDQINDIIAKLTGAANGPATDHR